MGNEYSQELIDLAFAALDHGIDSVRESGGPLIPFVMKESGADRSVDRFASDLLEEAVAQAIAHVQAVRGQPGTRHVLAYDGFLTLPTGERFDAIYAEGVEADSAVVMGLAQRYRPKRALRRFEAVGNPMLLPPGSSKLDL
jgi:hypothetical protein